MSGVNEKQDVDEATALSDEMGRSPGDRASVFSSPRFIRATIVVFIVGLVLAAAGFAIEMLSRRS